MVARMPCCRSQVRLAREEYVFVGQHPMRAQAWSAVVDPRDGDGVEHRGELRAVTGLAGCEQHRQWLESLLASQVELGRPTAPGPAQGVVGRLVAARRAGWFALLVTGAAGSSGGLMGGP